MVRRAIAAAAGLALAVGLLTSGSAEAQQSPITIETTTTSVLGTSTTNTTTTTTQPTTTTVEAEEVTPPRPPDTSPQVSGDVVRRPLPRTGTDLNGTALFGGALTVMGIALALGARRRRNNFEGA